MTVFHSVCHIRMLTIIVERTFSTLSSLRIIDVGFLRHALERENSGSKNAVVLTESDTNIKRGLALGAKTFKYFTGAPGRRRTLALSTRAPSSLEILRIALRHQLITLYLLHSK